MWLLDKLRGSVEGCGSKKTRSSASSASSSNQEPELQGVPVFVYANVLTPAKIPDFFIPPKLICCPPAGLEPEPDPLLLLTPEPQRRGLGPSVSDQAICSRSPKGAQRSPLKSPLFSRSLVKSANRHIIQIESVDNPADTPGTPNTNADPLSQTAMSLPYVPKAQTSYGFSTLVESPHTRRKESLFHSDPGSSPLTSPNAQRRGPAAAGGGGATLAPGDSPYRYFSGGESDTCSSAESSPFTSPLLSRSASILRSISQETQAKVFRAKRSLARHSSLSTDETCSSADNSPNVQRRRLRCSPSLSPFFGRKGGASSPGGGRGVATGGSSDLLQRAHTVNLRKGGRGTLRLSTHYDAEASRLRVRVLAAQDLYDRATDVKSINCCVALYLNPGKQQKQRSTIIKNSRHPVFNEDFFFDAVPRAALRDLALKMKVLNKGTSLKRDVMLGEREVLLSELLLG